MLVQFCTGFEIILGRMERKSQNCYLLLCAVKSYEMYYLAIDCCHKLRTHWPVCGAGNGRQSSGARNHDTLCQQIILTASQLHFSSRFYDDKFLSTHCREICFFFLLFSELKNVFITPLYISFLFVNK